jgi:transposase-like protein
LWQKSLAIFLYCHGVSMNALAKMFGVQPSTVLKWVRYSNPQALGKPEPAGVVTVMDFEEMWRQVRKETPGEGQGEGEEEGRLLIAIYDKDINGNLALTISPEQISRRRKSKTAKSKP